MFNNFAANYLISQYKADYDWGDIKYIYKYILTFFASK